MVAFAPPTVLDPDHDLGNETDVYLRGTTTLIGLPSGAATAKLRVEARSES